MPRESLASAGGEARRNGDSDSSALSSLAATVRAADCRHFDAFEDLLPFLDGATRVQRVQVQLDPLKERPAPSALVHGFRSSFFPRQTAAMVASPEIF